MILRPITNPSPPHRGRSASFSLSSTSTAFAQCSLMSPHTTRAVSSSPSPRGTAPIPTRPAGSVTTVRPSCVSPAFPVFARQSKKLSLNSFTAPTGSTCKSWDQTAPSLASAFRGCRRSRPSVNPIPHRTSVPLPPPPYPTRCARCLGSHHQRSNSSQPQRKAAPQERER